MVAIFVDRFPLELVDYDNYCQINQNSFKRYRGDVKNASFNQKTWRPSLLTDKTEKHSLVMCVEYLLSMSDFEYKVAIPFTASASSSV